MFKLKKSLATIAVIAGALAVAAPANAAGLPLENTMISGYAASPSGFMDYTDDALVGSPRATRLKHETEVTDY